MLSPVTTETLAAGAVDVESASAALASRLPAALRPLAELAYNYRWSWTTGGPELFASIDTARWGLTHQNPVRLLQEVPPQALERIARDEDFTARMHEVHAAVAADLARPYAEGAVTAHRPAAFFCAEYGVHQSLPVYSGGLGVLAGDILKAASDLAVPLVAIGLMYRHGYFRQRTDVGGWQHEYWVDTDADRVPAALVTAGDLPLTVSVPVGDRQVVAQVWRVEVGRIPLLLLDTNRPENTPADRFITSRLYVGEPDLRLAQYAVLGIGGVRVLRAMHVDPAVVHLNEGHAAFACLELARGEALRSGLEPQRRVRRRAGPHGLHHAHPGAGRQRHVPGRAGRGPALGRGGRARRRRVGAHRPRTHDPRRPPRAVRRHPVRAALGARGQRRRGPPRRGRARHVERSVARPRGRGRADHERHERRPPPDVARRPDARAARPPPRRGLAHPRRRPRDVDAGRARSPTPTSGPSAPSSAATSSRWSASAR